MYELVYTSTPQGLLTGRSGFTTVALTEGFPPNLIASIENLSGYKTLFEHGSEHERRNPVNFSCQPFTLGRTSYMVLSRISYAGISYTGRNNVLAHHLIFTGEELDRIPGGAAAVLRAEENFPEWSGKPRMLPLKHRIGSRPLPDEAEMWQKLAGSSQWAGYTAECFRADPDKGLVLAFDPLRISGTEILELIAETAARLTQDELRHFTFSTYCYSSGITNPLFFRSFVNDSARLGSIRRLEPDSIIHLGTDNPLPKPWTEKVLSSRCETDPLCPAGEAVREPEPFSAAQEPDPAAALPNEPVHPPRSGTYLRNAPSPGPAKTRQELPEGGSKNRRHIVALLIAVVVLGLCAAVFWRIYISQPASRQDNQDNDNSLDKTEWEESPPSRETEAEPQTPPSGRTADSVKADPDPEKPEPPASAEKTAAPKTAPKNQDPPEVELYRFFRKGGKRKLPESLRDTVALEVKIRFVGGMKVNNVNLDDFVEGKGNQVQVYARKLIDTGLGKDWVPDKSDVKNRMIFRLVENDSLEIIFPEGPSETAPRREDIGIITFIRRNNETYEFKPNPPPPAMTEFLNRQIEITVKRGKGSISFHMKVSDDLWDSRAFYSIIVNNNNLGDINQKELPLCGVQLTGVESELTARNEQVKEFHRWKSAEEFFINKNQPYLVQPELENIRLRNKFAEKTELDKLQTDASYSGEDAWLSRVNKIAEGITSELDKAVRKQERKKITDDLDRFRKECLKYAECKAQLNTIQKKVEVYKDKIQRQNKSLLKKLKACSQPLYRVASETLQESDDPQTLDSDFYHGISEEELKKDIKVQIIPKGRQ